MLCLDSSDMLSLMLKAPLRKAIFPDDGKRLAPVYQLRVQQLPIRMIHDALQSLSAQ